MSTEGVSMLPLDETTDPKLRTQILRDIMCNVLTDRERAKAYGLPEGCRIRERAKILAPENFKCGKFVWIGEGAVLDAQGGLSVGDYTQIGLNAMVWTHTSHAQALKSETCTSKKGITYKATKIGNNCFIAGPSVIGPGVTIGDRVIVSPMSFVDRDLPDGSVFSPKREMRDLQSRLEQTEELLKKILTLMSSAEQASAGSFQEILSQLKENK